METAVSLLKSAVPGPIKSLLRAGKSLAQLTGETRLAQYTTGAPSPQRTLDIFRGEWASQLPVPFDGLRAGDAKLFEDPRMKWALETLGGVAGKRILELGPLEGGHSYFLEKAGAASVTAVEANRRAYLKCLVVKELLGLPRTRFLFGEGMAFLRENPEKFDLIVAHGVLYHMENPVELLFHLGERTDAVTLWTHYFVPEILKGHVARGNFTFEGIEREQRGYVHTLYRQRYRNPLWDLKFWGGTGKISHWMTREGILGALRHFGFTRIEVAFDEPHGPHGPAFALTASR